MSLSHFLVRVREERGLSRSAVALGARVSKATLSNLERGAAKNLTVSVLVSLADALGVEPGQLVEAAASEMARVEPVPAQAPTASREWRAMTRYADAFEYDTNGGCWLWARLLDRKGYGKINTGERTVGAHRVIYEAIVGPVPDGLELDHLCRVTCCVNPAHLEPVTQRENNLRSNSASAKYARRTACTQGHTYTEATMRLAARPGGGSTRVCLICREARNAQMRQAAAARRTALTIGLASQDRMVDLPHASRGGADASGGGQ